MGKEPDLLKVALQQPDVLAQTMQDYRNLHGHAPSFERLQLFMRQGIQFDDID